MKGGLWLVMEVYSVFIAGTNIGKPYETMGQHFIHVL